MSRALNGHTSLRTRTVYVDPPDEQRERCPKCHAVLRLSNHGLCAPCAGVALPELTDWQLALLATGSNGIKAVAYDITGDKRPSRWSDLDERDARIAELAAEGAMARDIAEECGVCRSHVNHIIRGEGRGHTTKK